MVTSPSRPAAHPERNPSVPGARPLPFDSVRRVTYAMLLATSVGCGVQEQNGDTGGLGPGGAGADNGGAGADNGGQNPGGEDTCPLGTTIVLGDESYSATQIALSALDGTTLSESFLSTASTETAGLAFALSGDVVVPSNPPASGRIVLIDRFGTDVITWADPETAEVIAQLPVGTGFASNPHDYVEVGGGKAFVSRFGRNLSPGEQDHDEGDDVLVIDTETPAILGRIPLPVVGDVPPRASGMLRLGGEVIVALERITESWEEQETMLVGLSIEDEALVWQETLTGLRGCARPYLSPDGTRLAVACTGATDVAGSTADRAQSAIVLFDATERPLRELTRFGADDLAGIGLQNRIAFASDRYLLFATNIGWGEPTPNHWLALDLDSGEVNELLEGPDDGGGNVFTSITCAAGCSDICLLADSAEGVLQRVRLEGDTFELLDPVVVEDRVGLAPRHIGLR